MLPRQSSNSPKMPMDKPVDPQRRAQVGPMREGKDERRAVREFPALWNGRMSKHACQRNKKDLSVTVTRRALFPVQRDFGGAHPPLRCLTLSRSSAVTFQLSWVLDSSESRGAVVAHCCMHRPCCRCGGNDGPDRRWRSSPGGLLLPPPPSAARLRCRISPPPPPRFSYPFLPASRALR